MKRWLFVSLLVATSAFAIAPQMPVPPAAQPSAHFDVDAATQAYLDSIPPSAKQRSDAYFEGGYWLLLWDFLYGAAISLLLLNLGWSAKMRDIAERMTRFGPLRSMIYSTEWTIVIFVLGAPLGIYEGYVREKKYGLATQTFAGWSFDQCKGLMLNIILGAILIATLFGIVRKLQRAWWIAGSLAMIGFVILGVLITPIFIIPVFNKLTPLRDPAVTEPILRLARANGISVRDVYQMDASKQTTRMSANVSGFANTMRITLNDNLLRRGSMEEIQAVMGHEMGHYVLNHVYKFIVMFGVIIVVWFAALRWALDWSLARWGAKWGISGIGDLAVLPLVVLLSSFFFLLATPVMNAIVRTQEHEADMYGLNAARQPDGMAQAAIHLAEYRKMSPGRIEEWIFFDHPSGRRRIHDAMQWKAENLR